MQSATGDGVQAAATPASGYAADFSAGTIRVPKARARTKTRATADDSKDDERGGNNFAGGGNGKAVLSGGGDGGVVEGGMEEDEWVCGQCTLANQV